MNTHPSDNSTEYVTEPPEPYDADPGESVRSWFELSENSMSGQAFRDFHDQVRSEGWLINRIRKRADGMTNVYIVRPGYRGY